MEQEEFVLSFVAVFFAPLQLLFSFETITFFETLKVFFFQDLAQMFFFDPLPLVEHSLSRRKVMGSNPVGGLFTLF